MLIVEKVLRYKFHVIRFDVSRSHKLLLRTLNVFYWTTEKYFFFIIDKLWWSVNTTLDALLFVNNVYLVVVTASCDISDKYFSPETIYTNLLNTVFVTVIYLFFRWKTIRSSPKRTSLVHIIYTYYIYRSPSPGCRWKTLSTLEPRNLFSDELKLIFSFILALYLSISLFLSISIYLSL